MPAQAMSYDHFITWHFQELEAYVLQGIITKGQLGEIHRLRLDRVRAMDNASVKERRHAREREQIERALRIYEGNRKRAALGLMMSERSLYRKMKLYNLTHL